MIRRLRALRTCERGDFAPMMLVMIVTILLVTGFTVDAGRLLSARREVNDVATQAATAGTQVVDGTAVLAGGTDLGPQAVAAAMAYLDAVGVEGRAEIVGDTIIVETTAAYEPIMFGAIFGAREVKGRATARTVRGVDAAET